MKKEYFKPEVVKVDVMASAIIATSGNTTVEGGGGPLGPGKPEESAGHRGDWGNLWK